MTKEGLNEKAKEECFKCYEKCRRIEQEAKANGTWLKWGLDSNEYLFKEARRELKHKLAELRKLLNESEF